MANDEQADSLRSGDPTSDLWSADLSANHDKHYRRSDDYDYGAADYDDDGAGDDDDRCAYYDDGAADYDNCSAGPIDHGGAFHYLGERSNFEHYVSRRR